MNSACGDACLSSLVAAVQADTDSKLSIKATWLTTAAMSELGFYLAM